MYLHLGQDTVVRLDEIVGIFDMENATISKHTRRFLSDAQKGGRIFNVSMELPKSFVVCMDKNTAKLFIYRRFPPPPCSNAPGSSRISPTSDAN